MQKLSKQKRATLPLCSSTGLVSEQRGEQYMLNNQNQKDDWKYCFFHPRRVLTCVRDFRYVSRETTLTWTISAKAWSLGQYWERSVWPNYCDKARMRYKGVPVWAVPPAEYPGFRQSNVFDRHKPNPLSSNTARITWIILDKSTLMFLLTMGSGEYPEKLLVFREKGESGTRYTSTGALGRKGRQSISVRVDVGFAYLRNAWTASLQPWLHRRASCGRKHHHVFAKPQGKINCGVSCGDKSNPHRFHPPQKIYIYIVEKGGREEYYWITTPWKTNKIIFSHW